MSTVFWFNDPTILLKKEYIFELWPTTSMSYEQKSNAIARLIILLSVLGYIFTSSTKILITGFITLIVIFAVFKSNKQKITKEMMNEAFTVKGNQVTGLYENKKPATTTNPTTLETVLKSEFKAGTKKNPFSNQPKQSLPVLTRRKRERRSRRLLDSPIISCRDEEVYVKFCFYFLIFLIRLWYIL